jgi:hypothetical protein
MIIFLVLRQVLIVVDFVVTVHIWKMLLENLFGFFGLRLLCILFLFDRFLQENGISLDSVLMLLSMLLDSVRIRLKHMNWLLVVLFECQDKPLSVLRKRDQTIVLEEVLHSCSQ